MAQRPENARAKREYKPRPNRVGPRPDLVGPRPQLWKSGPIERDHEQYQAWLVHKAQANFRGEGHDLSYGEFREAWNTNNHWNNRGRASHNVCMTRYDSSQPWSAKNIVFETRFNYLSRQGAVKKGRKYKTKNNPTGE